MRFKHEFITEDECLINNEFKVNGLKNINKSLKIHFLIYKITNLFNGKFYIGQHITKNPLDAYMGSGLLLHRAYKKYGRKNFIKTILFDFQTKEEMNNKERELVTDETCNRNNPLCYNLTKGGTGGNKIIWTKENRQRVSNRLKIQYKGAGNPFYNKHHSNKTKKSISKHTAGKNNPSYDKVWLFNNKLKIRVYVKKDKIQQYLDNGYTYGLGLKWFNNGKENIRAIECPDGFTPGRLRLWIKINN